jgi:large subunit ribosomal protein L12
MEYIYSAMLLHSAGKEINEANLKKILEAAGVKADNARIKALTASLEGVDIEEAIKSAAAAPVPVAAAPASSGGASSEEGKKKEEKKEEEEEEEVSEEEAAAGLGALFG